MVGEWESGFGSLWLFPEISESPESECVFSPLDLLPLREVSPPFRSHVFLLFRLLVPHACWDPVAGRGVPGAEPGSLRHSRCAVADARHRGG